MFRRIKERPCVCDARNPRSGTAVRLRLENARRVADWCGACPTGFPLWLSHGAAMPGDWVFCYDGEPGFRCLRDDVFLSRHEDVTAQEQAREEELLSRLIVRLRRLRPDLTGPR